MCNEVIGPDIVVLHNRRNLLLQVVALCPHQILDILMHFVSTAYTFARPVSIEFNLKRVQGSNISYYSCIC